MAILNTAGNASVRGYGFTSAAGGKMLISSTPGPAATVTTYSGYIVFKFTASATLNVGAGAPGTADAFIVKGGGTGTNGAPSGVVPYGGTGGSTYTVPATPITANTPIPVVVGGAATNSTFGPLSSSSGSGGGVGGDTSTPGQGGPSNTYETGSSKSYAGGGGGGGFGPGSPAGGAGVDGGGPGGSWVQRGLPGGGPYGSPGANGTANTGGGGGGGGSAGITSGVGGSGGSGVVIVRFPDAQFRTS